MIEETKLRLLKRDRKEIKDVREIRDRKEARGGREISDRRKIRRYKQEEKREETKEL